MSISACENKLPVVVLRSNDCCFLGVLRSLTAANIPYIPVVYDWPGAPEFYSDHSIALQDPIQIDNPYTQETHVVKHLMRIGEKLLQQYGERILIIPSSDTNLMLLQNNWQHLQTFFRQIGEQSTYPLKQLVDKGLLYWCLQNHGIAQPKSFPCRVEKDIKRILKNISYPCIYKPTTKDLGQSFYREHDKYKIITCHDAVELETKLTQELQQGFELIVQEKIDTHAEVPVYLHADANHEISMCATAHKHMTHPNGCGTAYMLNLTWQPECLSLAKKVVKAMGWQGLLMIEMMQDKRDGQWKVIEINPRPWLFIDFFRLCGFNFLNAEYQQAMVTEFVLTPSVDILAQKPMHLALTSAYLLQDKFTQSGEQPSFADFSSWFTHLPGKLSVTTWRHDDPMPGLYELRQLAKQLQCDTAALIDLVSTRLNTDQLSFNTLTERQVKHART